MKNINRYLKLIVPGIVIELISLIIQKYLTDISENIIIKELINNAWIIGLILGVIVYCFLWIRWKYLDLSEKILKLEERTDKSFFIHKYYDIMLIKAQGNKQFHPFFVYEDDYDCFTEEEQKYLKSYLNDLEKLRIYKRGSNTVLGQFI